MSKEKLTMEELLDRLDEELLDRAEIYDAEFYDVDLTTHDSTLAVKGVPSTSTKGTVAVVHFYEDKLDDTI